MELEAKQGRWGLLGPLLSIISIVIVIGVEWFNAQSVLEIRELGQSTVVDAVTGIDKLEFNYAGRRIDGLTKVDVLVANTGRKAIRASDIVSPVMLLVDGGGVLEASVGRVVPADLSFLSGIDSTRRAVIISFALLNPGESARVSLLVASETVRMRAVGRVVGQRLLFVRSPPAKLHFWQRLHWNGWFAVAVALLSILGTLESLRILGKERAIARLSMAGAIRLRPVGTAGEFSAELARVFGDLKDSEFEELLKQLNAMDQTLPLTADRVNHLDAMLQEALKDTSAIASGVWVWGIAACVGIAYIAYVLQWK